MPKFKEGQIIEPIEKGRGLEQATVLGIYTETEKGRFQGRTMYRLKIPHGIATIPVEAEICYQLIKDK